MHLLANHQMFHSPPPTIFTSRPQSFVMLSSSTDAIEFLVSSHILWKSLFTKYPIIQCYIEWTTDNMKVTWKRLKREKNQNPKFIWLPSLSRSYQCSLSFKFPHQNRVCISFLSIYATFPVQHIQIKFGEEHISCSSLYSFKHSPVSFTLLSPDIFLIIYSETPSINAFPSVWKTKFQTHTKQYAKSLFYTVSSYWRDCIDS